MPLSSSAAGAIDVPSTNGAPASSVTRTTHEMRDPTFATSPCLRLTSRARRGANHFERSGATLQRSSATRWDRVRRLPPPSTAPAVSFERTVRIRNSLRLARRSKRTKT